MFWRVRPAPSTDGASRMSSPIMGRPSRLGRGHMTKTVLIVEDNELNMKLFHDLLDAHGYKTLQTRNGMEALGARPRASPRSHPDGYPVAGGVGARSDQMAEGGR